MQANIPNAPLNQANPKPPPKGTNVITQITSQSNLNSHESIGQQKSHRQPTLSTLVTSTA
eukprot:966079-Amorphochlora_amoeboformis.AAC.1